MDEEYLEEDEETLAELDEAFEVREFFRSVWEQSGGTDFNAEKYMDMMDNIIDLLEKI